MTTMFGTGGKCLGSGHQLARHHHPFGALQAKNRIRTIKDDWQLKLDNFVRQRDRLTSENAKYRTTIEQQQGAIHRAEVTVAKMRTELESGRERIKQTPSI